MANGWTPERRARRPAAEKDPRTARAMPVRAIPAPATAKRTSMQTATQGGHTAMWRQPTPVTADSWETRPTAVKRTPQVRELTALPAAGEARALVGATPTEAAAKVMAVPALAGAARPRVHATVPALRAPARARRGTAPAQARMVATRAPGWPMAAAARARTCLLPATEVSRPSTAGWIRSLGVPWVAGVPVAAFRIEMPALGQVFASWASGSPPLA